MFDNRDWFKTEEAWKLYNDAQVEAYAHDSRDDLEVAMCNYRAIGMLIMAQEIEPLNPHVAWMLAWITNFNDHGTEFLIDLMNKTLNIFEGAKEDYPNIDCNHLAGPIRYGLEAFIKAREDGVLVTR